MQTTNPYTKCMFLFRNPFSCCRIGIQTPLIYMNRMFQLKRGFTFIYWCPQVTSIYAYTLFTFSFNEIKYIHALVTSCKATSRRHHCLHLLSCFVYQRLKRSQYCPKRFEVFMQKNSKPKTVPMLRYSFIYLYLYI